MSATKATASQQVPEEQTMPQTGQSTSQQTDKAKIKVNKRGRRKAMIGGEIKQIQDKIEAIPVNIRYYVDESSEEDKERILNYLGKHIIPPGSFKNPKDVRQPMGKI